MLEAMPKGASVEVLSSILSKSGQQVHIFVMRPQGTP